MKTPKLESYDENILVAIANQTNDYVKRNKIKSILIEKITSNNYSYLYLINKFLNSNGIIKEVYAEVITLYMGEYEYYMTLDIMNEIIRYVSLDSLIYYGAESKSLTFSDLCKREFYERGKLLEDKDELRNKKYFGWKKRKVIKNDKY